MCVCYGSIAAVFATLLIAKGRESVCMRESGFLYTSNLHAEAGLCVRHEHNGLCHVRQAALVNYFTRPLPFSLLLRQTAKSSRRLCFRSLRVSLYKAAVIIPSVEREARMERCERGSLSVWDGGALITRHRRWQASAAHQQIKRNPWHRLCTTGQTSFINSNLIH